MTPMIYKRFYINKHLYNNHTKSILRWAAQISLRGGGRSGELGAGANEKVNLEGCARYTGSGKG